MGWLVVLKLARGSFEDGFPVTLQIGTDGARPDMEVPGQLPPAPDLPQLYGNWQTAYRRSGLPSRLEALAGKTSNVSRMEDCCHAAQVLRECLNAWLWAESFRPLREKWLEKLKPSDEVRVLLQTDDLQLQRLPWHLWDLFERYPQAEIALSAPAYEGTAKRSRLPVPVKILAILGQSEGIDTQADRSLLEYLPQAEIQILVEPQRSQLSEHLWEQGWDILFFAGHSSSQGKEERGRIVLNGTDSLTLDQLKYALKKAVAGGLSITIFNSCDGLGLARELADLHIPQIVFMREPVPDQVAQAFLKYFLGAFAQGQSLYLAVREARERLQGLEDRFPCATWLPAIYQNPSELPPTWSALCGRTELDLTQDAITKSQELPPFPLHWPSRTWPIRSSILAALLVICVRWLGILQPLELWAFDRLLRLRPDEGSDPRLLIVTITERDIQAQNEEPRRGSLSDASLARLLEKLESYRPRVIGLDVYRDFSVKPHRQDLAGRLRHSDRLIAVCKGKDPEGDPDGIKPPPEIPQARLGFSDFVEDADGILRRHLLWMTPESILPCPAPYAFSVQLAFRYLAAEGVSLITPQGNLPVTPQGNLQVGNAVFWRIQARTGGYQPVDAAGNQILLNYRSLPTLEKIARQVTLTEILTNQLPPEAVKDKLILIGVTAPNTGDYWATPYGAGPSQKISGVFIQAHMVSQILSAVLDRRPLLRVWPQWGEALWIWLWALVGSILAWRFRRLSHRVWGGAASLLVLSALCLALLIQGWWVDLIPPVLAFLAAGVLLASTLTEFRQ